MGAEVYTVPARFLTTMAHLIATLTVLYDVVRVAPVSTVPCVYILPLLRSAHSTSPAAPRERSPCGCPSLSSPKSSARTQRVLLAWVCVGGSDGRLPCHQENVAAHAIDAGDSLSSAKSSCVTPLPPCATLGACACVWVAGCGSQRYARS
jgi:hypothetical protein